MSHEGWLDALMRVELVDPGLGEVSVAGLVPCTHGHEECAERLITAGTDQEVLGEAIVQSPAFDPDSL